MAVGRIPLGRRGRQLLFCRSPGRHARYLHGAGPDAGRSYPTGAEDDHVRGAGQGPAQGLIVAEVRWAQLVMPGLVPGIHVLGQREARKTWMAGSSPAMTEKSNPQITMLQIRLGDQLL